MKRLYSKKDLKWYTLMLNVLNNLELTDKDYMWLISDIEAYPINEKYAHLINDKDYILLTTDELVKMLNDEVNRQKGLNTEETKEKNYQIQVSHHVDALYVGDDALRIEVHKVINKVKSRQDQEKLIQEFKDRYGTVKDEILLYIEAKYLEHLLKTKGIEFFKETQNDVKLTISEEKTQSLSAKQLYDIVTKTTLKFRLEYINRKVNIYINRKDFATSYIYTLNKVLEKL